MEVAAVALSCAAIVLSAFGILLTIIRKQHETIESLASKVFMLKGLHPHMAAPEQFTPAAISRKDWKELQEPVAAEPVDEPDPDADNRDEFLAAMAEHNAKLDKARAARRK